MECVSFLYGLSFFGLYRIGFDSSSIGLTSVGVMEEGEYTFSTAQPEEMTVITGALKVLLPGAPDWQVFTPGEKFFVPGPTRLPTLA